MRYTKSKAASLLQASIANHHIYRGCAKQLWKKHKWLFSQHFKLKLMCAYLYILFRSKFIPSSMFFHATLGKRTRNEIGWLPRTFLKSKLANGKRTLKLAISITWSMLWNVDTVSVLYVIIVMPSWYHQNSFSVIYTIPNCCSRRHYPGATVISGSLPRSAMLTEWQQSPIKARNSVSRRKIKNDVRCQLVE